MGGGGIPICKPDRYVFLCHSGLKTCIDFATSRSENGYGFYRPGLKMGVANYIFGSEIGSGFGEPGSTPPRKNSQEN